MKRPFVFALLAAYAFFSAHFGIRIPATAAENHQGDNAALKYWAAFSLKSRPGGELWKRVGDATTYEGIVRPVDDKMADVVKWNEYSLRMFRRGAELADCDWETDIAEDGIETLLPYVGEAHAYMRISLLRARYRFENGDHMDAIEDVVATLALGRHVAHDEILASLHVDYAIEKVAMFVAAAYFPQLSSTELDALATRLDSLPKRTTARQAHLTDRVIIDSFVAKLEKTDADELEKFLLNVVGTQKKSAVDAILRNSGGVEGLVARANELRPLYGQMLEAFAVPPAQRDEAVIEQIAKKVESNPIGNLLFPDMLVGFEAEKSMLCKDALFKAAIDVAKRGKLALKDHPDPHGEGAFEFEEFPGGFELRSRLSYRAKGESIQRKMRAGIRKDGVRSKPD